MSSVADVRSENLPIAIALTTVAGGATAVGGAIVFNKKYIDFASSERMAKLLAFTAGVMLVVGQFYLLHEALEEGGYAGFNGGEKYAVAWASFFAGVLLVKLIDVFTHRVLGVAVHVDAQEYIKREQVAEKDAKKGAVPAASPASSVSDMGARNDLRIAGLNGALAIALHNIPEGIITFFAALKDPSMGFALALAIAIHNVPEGVGVAIPLFYADGSRWKAFLWCCLSGVAEPVGALIAYAAVADAPSHAAFAVIYGLCSGVIVEVIFHDLLLAAMKYAAQPKHIYQGVMAGVTFMGVQFMLYKGVKQLASE